MDKGIAVQIKEIFIHDSKSAIEIARKHGVKVSKEDERKIVDRTFRGDWEEAGLRFLQNIDKHTK